MGVCCNNYNLMFLKQLLPQEFRLPEFSVSESYRPDSGTCVLMAAAQIL